MSRWSGREQAQILKKEGMKRVLVLGSGYVSGPVVEYLTRDPGTQVTIGEAPWLIIVMVYYGYYELIHYELIHLFMMKPNLSLYDIHIVSSTTSSLKHSVSRNNQKGTQKKSLK